MNDVLMDEKLSVVKQQVLSLAEKQGLKIVEQKDINEQTDVGKQFKKLGVNLSGMSDVITVSYWNDEICNWVQLFWTLNKYRTWRKVYNFLVKQITHSDKEKKHVV